MDIPFPEAGTYVVAVSGGVDSMALLHMLATEPGLRLIVAHFDHGIRPNSASDEVLVERFARALGVPFVSAKGELGPMASEADAREARYLFLRAIQNQYEAKAIITAHHQDDRLETAILNVLRGTNRRGLSSLSEHAQLRRPFLAVTKEQLIEYAYANQLTWNEDETNTDEAYARNYVRQRLMPKLTTQDKRQLLKIVEDTHATNEQLNTLLVKYLTEQMENDGLDRLSFVILPHKIAREVMAAWLRTHHIQDYDQLTLERLTIAAKVAPINSRHNVRRNAYLVISQDSLALKGSER